MKRIYLDHNATTPLHPDVQTALKSALKHFGNPSSLHQTGQTSRELIQTARDQVATLINCDPTQLIFTSSGTEANNMVLKSPLHHTQRHLPLPQIITTPTEHASILTTCQFLADTHHQPITYLPVTPQGTVTPETLASHLTDHTALISIMSANNETGSLSPLSQLSQVPRHHLTLFHTDATQAIGKIPVDVRTQNIDFLTLSAHKIQGPKGVGALYIKHPNTLTPLLHGGSQEQTLRPSTENLLGIIGFGVAATLARTQLTHFHAHTHALRAQLLDGLQPIPNIHINTPLTHSLPNTLNLSILGIPAETLVIALDQHHIDISTGSACSTGSTEPSHVIQAITSHPDILTSAIRISLGPTTTPQDIQTLLTTLHTLIPKLRAHYATQNTICPDTGIAKL